MARTKKDRVYSLIKNAIISGDLEAGHIFSIDELSQRFKFRQDPHPGSTDRANA